MADRDYLKELTRKALIRNPKLTVRGLAELLGVAFNTALSIRDEVVEERKKEVEAEIEKLKKRTLEQELIDYEEEMVEVVTELWKIINGKGSTNGEKTAAVRALVDAKKNIFDIKFDSGLFARKLGEMSLNVPELAKLVKENVRDKSGENNSGDTTL